MSSSRTSLSGVSFDACPFPGAGSISEEDRPCAEIQLPVRVLDAAQKAGKQNDDPSRGARRIPTAGARRVLHVINGEHFSGAERVQQLLGKRLGQFGFEAQFVCVKPGKFATCCELRASQVLHAEMRARFDLSVVKRIVELAKENQSELLHAHTPRTALVASIAARRIGIPWVYHVHSPTARDSTRGVLNRVNSWMEWYAVRQCDLLLTVSRSLRREMLRLGVPRNRLAVVANGVPAIEPIDVSTRTGSVRISGTGGEISGTGGADRTQVDNSTWLLGMVALMRPRKGVEVALKAMELLKQQKVPVQLDLIGGFETEEYEAEILEAIRSKGLSDMVRWKGFTNDIPNAIRRLDGLLLPSLFGEGMPMVVLEAIAAAVPVVATRVEGTPEVIRHDVEGYLAEPRCPKSLAKQIKRLTHQRENWARLSQNALRRHRESFSDVRMAERVANAYKRVLDTRGIDGH